MMMPRTFMTEHDARFRKVKAIHYLQDQEIIIASPPQALSRFLDEKHHMRVIALRSPPLLFPTTRSVPSATRIHFMHSISASNRGTATFSSGLSHLSIQPANDTVPIKRLSRLDRKVHVSCG